MSLPHHTIQPYLGLPAVPLEAYSMSTKASTFSYTSEALSNAAVDEGDGFSYGDTADCNPSFSFLNWRSMDIGVPPRPNLLAVRAREQYKILARALSFLTHADRGPQPHYHLMAVHLAVQYILADP